MRAERIALEPFHFFSVFKNPPGVGRRQIHAKRSNWVDYASRVTIGYCLIDVLDQGLGKERYYTSPLRHYLNLILSLILIFSGVAALVSITGLGSSPNT